mmetsp:Transcript_17570/g.38038  ORF Transcript_17570/g.38038 Transcript_17570/m.38038 type:complete len:405 (+) Transcript_17570:216-1430(+)|eukprot:CAMPEP_0172308664 /NCGR_PEP_ID=MMETSP1058-20130122/9196_1 /TAXON_ID=83371 /ORGANISM="Detonula confervacea, Strain CCMP 353" /LENGTH=404 /DNA_ID=CAMNT_0013021135 /DNA_START=130 /DNA_END=1344 /DNA_ORIENTATION=-
MCRHTEELDESRPFMTSDPAVSPASRRVPHAASYHFPGDNNQKEERARTSRVDLVGFIRFTGALILLFVCMMSVGLLLGSAISTHGFQDGSIEIQDDSIEIEKHGVTNADKLSTIDQELLSFLSTSSFARDSAIDVMVNEYTTEFGEDGNNTFDRFESAVKVLRNNTHDEDEEVAAIDIITDKLSTIDQELLSILSTSSFARDSVIDLMVNEYTTDFGHDGDNRLYRFESAVEAIGISETDAEPIQVKGHPFLFVGSIGASRNEESLHRNNITHVINWSPWAHCNVVDDIEYLCFTGILTYKQMIHRLDDLDKAVDFIESARKAGGKAMSHCWYGRNRSITLLVAYLMKYEGMSIKDGHHLVKETRPIADPYLDVLHKYAEHYLIGSKAGKKKYHQDDDYWGRL